MNPFRARACSPSTPSARSAGRTRAGLAATAVLGLALTACGGGESPADASASTSASSSASASASATPSASPSASASTEGAAGDSAARQEYVDAVTRGAQDEDVSVRTRVTSTVDTPQGEFETVVAGVTQLQDGTLSARFDTTLGEEAGGGMVRTLIVDGTFYVQAPGIPKGKYAEIDIAQAAGPLGEQLQQQIEQIDPRAQAQATIDSLTSVEKVGESTVNGADVTEYRVTQDFAEFAQGQDNQLFTQLLESGAAPGIITSTVFLDEDGRVRRSVVDLDVQGSAVRTVAEFLAYDVDVDITKPAAKNIVQAPGLGGAGGAGNG